MRIVTGVNTTIRGLNDRVFRRFKAKAVEEGMKLGDAVTQAMELWIKDTEHSPRSRITKIRPFNWGKGSERVSLEIDKILYEGKT